MFWSICGGLLVALVVSRGFHRLCWSWLKVVLCFWLICVLVKRTKHFVNVPKFGNSALLGLSWFTMCFPPNRTILIVGCSCCYFCFFLLCPSSSSFSSSSCFLPYSFLINDLDVSFCNKTFFVLQILDCCLWNWGYVHRTSLWQDSVLQPQPMLGVQGELEIGSLGKMNRLALIDDWVLHLHAEEHAFALLLVIYLCLLVENGHDALEIHRVFQAGYQDQMFC